MAKEESISGIHEDSELSKSHKFSEQLINKYKTCCL